MSWYDSSVIGTPPGPVPMILVCAGITWEIFHPAAPSWAMVLVPTLTQLKVIVDQIA
ncbi:hypothetical protein [Luteimonas aquatica]|uniref:hypothetical protein n=1 Tax=Luteimonas aquatica TaxID=450364 RepID=UPI001F55C3D2|nr:hypothetical protein [Luteimonas aquatica]